MEIREITNKDEWEGFLQTCPEKGFLHSWNWGEISARGGSASGGNLGNKIWRFGAFSEGKIIGVVLVLKISARRGTFLFIPHGPVVISGLEEKDKEEILQLVLTNLEGIIKEEKASFVRIAPIWQRTPENVNIFEGSAFRQAPIHMHPEVTWELDITSPQENLLANMRKTTRYLIRQAEKNPDIEIVKSTNIQDLKLFWPVYLETAKRHKFVVFSEKYLEAEFNIFSKDGQILLFLGRYKGEVVSAAIFVVWQDMCFYHHSGSLSKYNKIPVSYLLQWEAIKEAKNRGCKTYNFWGIAPDVKNEKEAQKSRHPWAGLSLFKMGFGGYKKEYVKTQDLAVLPKYWLNYIIEKMRKAWRRL
jgi:lipid II:glycine glycyltransferase (peptidoglycan interpeptide bridge formation enzyme)